jgi:hypothetical protein
MNENDVLLLGSLLVVGMLALARICYDVLYEGRSCRPEN